MVVYSARAVVNFVDDFFAYDISIRLAEELMPTPSDEYADWRYECQKYFNKMQRQIYNLILEF
jgi:hypothetical protein